MPVFWRVDSHFEPPGSHKMEVLQSQDGKLLSYWGKAFFGWGGGRKMGGPMRMLQSTSAAAGPRSGTCPPALSQMTHHCRALAGAWGRKSPSALQAFPQEHLMLKSFLSLAVLHLFTRRCVHLHRSQSARRFCCRHFGTGAL